MFPFRFVFVRRCFLNPLLLVCGLMVGLLISTKASAQKAYFVDGYHGGKWGHYPPDYTQFILDNLAKYPEWKLNLEIEPETWDWVQEVDPEGYQGFIQLLDNQGDRIEFVNPAYGQPYLFNIAGESIIRQLGYGMRHLRRHFPSLEFLTYSSEEPCFTSALPQLLTSFGFRYASLKNPNTCWGGYVRAYGKDLLQWQGPDGTAILTAPRYDIEELKPGSTWETIGNFNSKKFIRSAFASGIAYPVAMCLQDAGWRKGPWLGKNNGEYRPTEHILWRDYFALAAPKVDAPIWHLSQEDIQVSLVWGAQVLQRIAQRARHAESSLLMAERSATMDWFFRKKSWPKQAFDEAWRMLFLAQHHDCWIVPYNRVDSLTWAGKVDQWTSNTHEVTNHVLTAHQPVARDTEPLAVRNTIPYQRKGVVTYLITNDRIDTNLVVKDANGRARPTQWQKREDGMGVNLLFIADVPAMSDRFYLLGKPENNTPKPFVTVRKERTAYLIESDEYRITLDTARGGVITSLRSKSSFEKEWVDTTSVCRGFNELRGFFYQEHAFRSSAEHPATVTILEQGPVCFKLAVKGMIAGHPFTQELVLVNGQSRIDFKLTIDWQDQPRIGQYEETDFKAENRNKAFYNDRYKLLLLFPTALKGQQVMKNAPYDVTQSVLEDTFFSRWDSIKNNVILDWVDVVNDTRQEGIALFTDHTTSYVHGKDHPLGLTVQYAGKGLWGRDYTIDGPTSIAYSLLPHRGTWDNAQLWLEDDCLKSPLFVSGSAVQDSPSGSLVQFDKAGYQLSALYVEDNELILRVFNAASDDTPLAISLPQRPARITMEELDGRTLQQLKAEQTTTGEYALKVSMPRFGIRTVRLRFENQHHIASD